MKKKYPNLAIKTISKIFSKKYKCSQLYIHLHCIYISFISIPLNLSLSLLFLI